MRGRLGEGKAPNPRSSTTDIVDHPYLFRGSAVELVLFISNFPSVTFVFSTFDVKIMTHITAGPSSTSLIAVRWAAKLIGED
ncbi:hypothetical protein EB835_18705 [Brevibacterium sp. S22]|nr:hypothetical protein EB835_18705 [Brevibacterium sp. S22]